ncbi:hypothetical protein DPM19_30685 [Actinomadura craniellae]|uniref:O-antigen ligase-related domain-containing protein n=1 Tax=Actinomadura craniellae TaxID=2231787 RepID=A0A365GZM1_9ACTN|nr:O-antigen ligase family protein [Actinomadura craniellae]RAY11393.1 hypothetical protein DPM19_30685 [Actinomadura craniellae]
MTTVSTHPPIPRAVWWAGGLAAGAAAYTGVQVASGAPRAATVLPLALAGAAALGWLALTRFFHFVLAVLVLRSALDAVKLGGALDTSREATVSGLLDPGTILGVLFVVAGTAWLAVQGPGGAAGRALPWAMLGLLGATALGAVGSRAAGASAGEVMRVAALVVMLLVVRRLVADDPGRREPLLLAVFAAAVLPVLTTVHQVGTGNGLVDVHGVLRAHGTFWHPNMLGIFCALLLVMGVALLPHVPALPRAGLFLLGAGLGFALVFSYARGAWLALALGLVVVALLQDRRILVGLAAAGAVVLVAVPSVTARLSDLSDPAGSLSWRFEHWGRALDLVGANPVTGVGPAAARALLGREVHNDYLRALVETGLVGLLACLALLAALALTARRALREARSPLARGVAVGFAGCVAALALFAVADNVLTSVAVLWYLLVFAGIASGEPR